MCIRLYPDIIVATEINNIRNLNVILNNTEPDNIVLSIGKLLYKQKSYNQFGINEYWGVDDYVKYFENFPTYFNRKTDDLWEVRFDLIKDGNSAMYTKILIHGYSSDVWKKFGLHTYKRFE